MQVIFSKSFKKEYKKMPVKHKRAFEKRLKLFLSDNNARILNNHKLHGEYANCNSINITGDIRAIFYLKDSSAIFIRIGTHSELY